MSDDQRMSRNTSVGRGPASGGNENHDGDPTHTTLGETVGQEAPAGSDAAGGAAPDAAAAIPCAKPRPGVAQGPQAYPGGPPVEPGPRQPGGVRGKPHRPG